MHPAYSVILFTTSSGAGYGLLALVGVLNALGMLPQNRWFGFVALGLALTMVTAGLLASTFHLGRPERAWRAFSQWRSSWLSREGVAAVATYVPAGLLGIGWVFFENNQGVFAISGLVASVLAIVTIYCTGMIYASLKTIRQWHDPIVPTAYIALGLATGALLLSSIMYAFAVPSMEFSAVTALLIGAAAIVKLIYWHKADHGPRKWTPEAATGLGHIGKVRPLEPAHSQPNFLMREMGYKIARKHAQKLRRMALILAFAVPLGAILVSLIGHAMLGLAATLIALASAAVGIVLERWLFFAEAEHVVNVYYGAEAA